jgi:glycosyltransferase involved in cell wall biosynthesis
MNNQVSLVMTIYNRERYLSTAIESVLRQSYGNFELILWDDGSTDGSVEIARQYAQQDERICLIEAEHRGTVHAHAAAYALSTGDYIGWVDSDDALVGRALAQTVGYLDQHPAVGVVYSDCVVIDAQSKVIGKGARSQIPYSPMALLQDFMTFHFRLMRRSVFEAAGGINTAFCCAIDYELCLRLSEVTQIVHLPEVLYLYRCHGDQMSTRMQIEQIQCSEQAVRQALERRGLGEQYDLQVKVVGYLKLIPKRTPD